MKYEIELWSKNGQLLADITRYVKNLKWSEQRNEAEDVSFSMNLDAFQDLATSIGTAPQTLLFPYQTDVKIKRNGVYRLGAHVGEVTVTGDENTEVMEIRAFGYLNLLIDRYVTKTYTNEDGVDIAWDLINETQSQTNGDMGITQGAFQAVTTDRDRTYERQNVKEAIVNLTNLATNRFDFQFTPSRVFNTYTMLGSQRLNIQFTYPGLIKGYSVPRIGQALSNKIYGIGSGFGEEALTSTQGDNDSQLNYGVHERIITWNSVVEQDTLDQNTAGQLELRKEILEIPSMKVSGRDFDLNLYGVGDRVPVKINDRPYLSSVDGIYRIERIEVSVDENEAEDIDVYFDNIDESIYEDE